MVCYRARVPLLMMGILQTFIGGLLWDGHQIYQKQKQFTLNYFHFRDSLHIQ